MCADVSPLKHISLFYLDIQLSFNERKFKAKNNCGVKTSFKEEKLPRIFLIIV